MLGLAALTGRRRERRRWLKQRDTCPGVQRIIVTRYGPPEVLRLEEAETPAPAEGEVLVRVARAGINFADLLARMGLYPGVPKPPFVPGHEVAGTVEALGPAVDGLAVGDRVVAGRSFGGYASHTVAPQATVTRLSDSVSFDAAAALPVNYLTAWLAVVHPGALQPGETLLIHGAAGGVGVAATQLARIRGAARIFGTASPGKHDWLREQGVEPVPRDDFRAAIKAATDGRGVDLVLDPVGGDHLLQGYRCLAAGGRIVTYGISAMAPGRRRSRLAQLREWWRTPRFNPLWMMGANRAVIGVHLGRYRDVARLQQAQAELFGWLESGEIAPHIDSIFPGAKAAKAHQYIHDRKNIGKVLLNFE